MIIKPAMTIMKTLDETTSSDEELDTKEETLQQTSSDDENDDDDDDITETNAGWVDSISKILKTKKPKGKKTLVLAKAKKLTEVKPKVKPEDHGFLIDGEAKEEKKVDVEDLINKLQTQSEPSRKRRRVLPNVRVKPDVLQKDRERTLSKIATRGVVQLFNAVQGQQNDISKRLDDAGPLERKRDKVLKSIDKRAFLDVLMGEKSQVVRSSSAATTDDIVVKSQDQSTWNILRDDFMMDAKLKDWDKEVETAETEEELNIE